jgi:methanethiol S-methyltransferase
MLVFILLLVFFYASHSWLASVGVKQFISKLSPAIFSFYRLLYTVFSVIVWGVITWWFTYKHEYNFLFPQSAGLTYAGIIFAAVGLLIISLSIFKYGFMEFSGLNSFTTKQITKNPNPELNTGGMNAIVRHPIYSGILLALIGLLLCLPTQMTVAGILVSLVYLEVGIRLEEKKLEAEFEGSYNEYKKKVKKVVPWLY